MEPPILEQPKRHSGTPETHFTEPTSCKPSPQLLVLEDSDQSCCVVEERLLLGSKAERDTAPTSEPVAEASSAQADAQTSQASEGQLTSEASQASGLLELLDEGWFKENVAWFGSRWFGLSTIKESPNEAEEQGDEGECSEERATRKAEVQGKVMEAQAHSPCNSRDSRGAAQELPDAGEVRSRQAADLDAGRRRGGSSPYSSDEDSVHSQRGGRRRGRSGQRRRTKRSSSAENARASWFGESQDGPGRAALSGRSRGSTTPPHKHAFPQQPLDERSSPGVGQGRPQFLRTRSVSDYEAKGPRTSSLWDTPPGARPKSTSLTDADVEELQGFVDLGFKFQQSHISPQITATLPALRLYQAVGSVQQRIMSQRHGPSAAGSTDPAMSSTSVPASQCLSSENGGDSDSNESSASLPNDVPWSIADPSDNPVDVKNTLRLWAQAVASTVRQTC